MRLGWAFLSCQERPGNVQNNKFGTFVELTMRLSARTEFRLAKFTAAFDNPKSLYRVVQRFYT